MQHKLSESISDTGTITFDFIGFDDWKTFVKIMEIVEDRIKPDKSNYQGVTDMNGFFEKDGLRVEIQYDEMIGNFLEFKGEKTNDNLIIIREWAQLIFDSLKIEIKGKKA